jgi:DeoR/GlpR family transcriptional regulator of sugar metabolism
MEADTDRALIEAGRRLVVVADHTKWGVIGIATIARLDEADVLVTDTAISPTALGALRGAIKDVVLAPTASEVERTGPVSLSRVPRGQHGEATGGR